MHVKRWTLLDIDKVRGVPQNKGEKKSECNGKLNTKFWNRHKGKLKLEEIKGDKIIHTFKNRISWFPNNIENFLLPQDNDNEDGFWSKRHHWWTSKEARIIGNISSDSFVKERERFEELKRELKKIIEWLEDNSYQISSSPIDEVKRLT